MAHNIIEYASRSIGDVFYTLRTDASLNGAVSCDGAEYSASDFSLEDMENPYVLCTQGYIQAVDYTQYDSIKAASNGNCAYFGYNKSTGKFRVPTLKDVFIETADPAKLSSELAKYLAPGLPNITAQWSSGNTDGGYHATGATYIGGSGGVSGRRNGNGTPGITFDASRSSAVYGKSNTVQPAAVKLRAMVQLVTSAGLVEEEEEEEPRPQLTIPYLFTPGKEAKALEVNANFDYVLRRIEDAMVANSTQPVVFLEGDQDILGVKSFKDPTYLKQIELLPDLNATHGGFIDFHFGGNTGDYTARLIESVKGFLSINQDPPSSDNTQKIATTKWVNSKISAVSSISGNFNTNGWIKFANGLMIQWGQVSTDDVGYQQTKTVTFPTAFPSTCFSMTQNTTLSQCSWDKADVIGLSDFTATNFKLFKGILNWSPVVTWIAIGC